MAVVQAFEKLSTCAIADVLNGEQFMELGIKSLWQPVPRIAGPAFTVKCPPGDQLMLHVAIHEAPAGSIIVVESGDSKLAKAGGNVCLTAKLRGIKGFVIDGVVRDLAEIEAEKFPVYARGIVPKPGKKERYEPLNQTIVCGGVTVNKNDIIIADEDGIVVVPSENAESILEKAQAKAEKEASQNIEDWKKTHKERINLTLTELGKPTID